MGKKKKELSPEEIRAERMRKAEKKRAARKRKSSAAALMGAMFSFIFVGTVLILLFKIILVFPVKCQKQISKKK